MGEGGGGLVSGKGLKSILRGHDLALSSAVVYTRHLVSPSNPVRTLRNANPRIRKGMNILPLSSEFLLVFLSYLFILVLPV